MWYFIHYCDSQSAFQWQVFNPGYFSYKVCTFADIGSNSTTTTTNNTNTGQNDEDFDMFAQSRKSFDTNKQAKG